MFNENEARELFENGYSYSQIASKLSCSYSTVCHKLQGETKKRRTIRKSCSPLHVRIGLNLSYYLDRDNLDLKRLFRLSGIHWTILSRILTGSHDIKLSELIRIAKAFRVEVEDLLK